MDSINDNESQDFSRMIKDYFANRNILTEEDESCVSMLEYLLKGNTQLTEEEQHSIFICDNLRKALEKFFEIGRNKREKNMTEEEREDERKRRLEDEIKDSVVLLFIQEFPDERTEERLKEWKGTGYFSRFRNYNESAEAFANNGGWRSIERMIYGWNDSTSIEGETIPIIELLDIIKSSDEINIKSKAGIAKSMNLKGEGKRLLESMIMEWLDKRINPYVQAKNIAPHSIESQERLLALSDSPLKEYVWQEDLLRTKEVLQNWHNEKVAFPEGKELDYYYSLWEKIIPWKENQNLTERMIFLYKLGIAFQLYPQDTSKDLDNYVCRKEVADKIKYCIKRQRNWEKKLGKRSGNFPE